MGTYGYKDGSGNDLYDNTAVNEFWDDFKTMETYYRKPGPAERLAQTAVQIGGPNISCKSNFNKTRAAGEMHQHSWALAMLRKMFYNSTLDCGSNQKYLEHLRWHSAVPTDL